METVMLNATPAVTFDGARMLIAAAAAGVIGISRCELVNAKLVEFAVSTTPNVWPPEVLKVTANVWTPASAGVNVYEAGNTACVSLLVKANVPEYPVAMLP